MSREHLPEDSLALYVMGALDEGRALAVEEHVAACAACAAALQREATLELQLHRIASDPLAADHASAPAPGALSPAPARPDASPSSPHARPSREPASRGALRLPRLLGALSAAAVALLAASLLLLAGSRGEARPRSSFVVACPSGHDGRAEAQCRAQARRRGLFVQFPPGEEIPVYEALGTKPGGRAP